MSTTVVSSSIVVPSRRTSRDEPPRREEMQSLLKRPAEDDEAADGESASVGNAQEGTSARRPSLSAPEAPKRPRLDLSNPDVKKRGQRLFANILGTLTKFKADAQHKSEADIQREQIDAKLQEKLRREKEELTVKVQQEQEERRLKMIEKRKDEEEMREAEMRRIWTAQKSNLTNYLRTETTPVLYYLPRKLTNEMTSAIAEQKRALVLASAAAAVPSLHREDEDTGMDMDEENHQRVSEPGAEVNHEIQRGRDEDEEMRDTEEGEVEAGERTAKGDAAQDAGWAEGAMPEGHDHQKTSAGATFEDSTGTMAQDSV